MAEAAVAKPDTDPEAAPPRGIRCPRCECPWAPVSSERPLTGGKVRQYRRCKHCDATFTTTVTVEPDKKPAADTEYQTLKGVYCPKCLCDRLRVLYTRPLVGGKTRRCRICAHCKHRFYTVETDNARSK